MMKLVLVFNQRTCKIDSDRQVKGFTSLTMNVKVCCRLIVTMLT